MNDTILKIGHFAKVIGQFGSKLKNAKNHSTRTIQLFCQKTALKHINYSSNKTILKIAHVWKAKAHAKSIAFAKW